MEFVQSGEVAPCSEVDSLVRPLLIENNTPTGNILLNCVAHPAGKGDMLPPETGDQQRTLAQRLADYCMTCPLNVGYRPPEREIDPFKWS